jgi:gluconate 5-dehydrogenase
MDFENAFHLNGELALVTGGATGLGFAISKCLLRAGARVVIAGIEAESALKDACAALGDGAFYRRYDVTDTKGADILVKEICAEIGDISILVNNAGVHCKKPIEETTDEDFRKVFDVHIMGAFALSRAVVPVMKKNKHGSIIFQASMTAFIGQPYVIAYAAAKSGYLGMVRTLATELSADGIRVNAVAPGWIDTPMLHKAIDNDPERKNKILGRTPTKTFGKPEDIGWAVVFLASKAAGFINGVALPVDGGALIGF